MTSGLFLTFEGIDGSGKSTQLNLLAEALRRQGHDVVVTRNPGGTEFGKQMRQIVLHSSGQLCDTSELLLFMADRAQHYEEIILPALNAGKIILCDRHGDSTAAYQGYGRGLDLKQIADLNQLATHGRKPDKTFLYDGDPELLRARVNARGQADRLEGEKLEFFTRARQGFLELAKASPERFVVFDATLTQDDLQTQLQAVVRHLVSSVSSASSSASV